MQQETPSAIVQQWHSAVNDRDISRIVELSHSNIAVSGPRGSGHGHQLLLEWLARSGLRFETLRTFGRGGDIVVAQHGTWHSPDTGEPTEEADFATHFRVESGQIVYLSRHESLDAALAGAGMDQSDELPRE